MSTETHINWQQDGTLEVTAHPLEESEERGSVSGYWRGDGNGHSQKVEPYFYLGNPATVTVTTTTTGKVSVTLNLYNDSSGHGGPSLPQSGGSTHLGPGQWRLYFTGSISTYPRPSGIEVRVSFPGREAERTAEEPPVEAVIEEERGQQFKARAVGSSRPQAIRIAYRRADQHAAGRPYRVLEERVYAQANQWVCILSCELT